jgi:hypothetical protein
MPRAIDLVRVWGFEYKTVAFYWVKLNAKPKHNSNFGGGTVWPHRRKRTGMG